MSFQKCPKCDGTGFVYTLGISNHIRDACPVCKGAMIISELTGKPPVNLVIAISQGENYGKADIL